MILISTTTRLLPEVQAVINSEYRLNELVSVTDEVTTKADIIVNEYITISPVWNNNLPPVLFPEQQTTTEAIKGFAYARLGTLKKQKHILRISLPYLKYWI